MRLGILDIGTLSFRFDIFEVNPLKLEPVKSFRLMHRAGEFEMATPAEFASVADRIIVAFDEIVKLAKENATERITGSLTGFFRKHPEFAERILAAAKSRGIDLRVLSGQEESTLIAEAVIRFFSDRPETALLLDIGGGSSEVSIIHGDRLVCGRSVPLGVLVVKSEFPPAADGSFSPTQLLGLKGKLAGIFGAVKNEFYASTDLRPEIVIGSSGSARELERILAPGSGELSLAAVDEFYEKISGKSYDELRKMDRVDAARADLLVPGTAIFSELMRAFSMERAKISHYSLRHGILAAEIC